MSASHSRPAPHSYRAGSSPMQTILTTQATLKRRAAAALVASALLACTAVVGIEDLPPLANTGDAGDAADGAVSPDAVAPSRPASCEVGDYTLTGTCDVFKQDCPAGQRCAVVPDSKLGQISACVAPNPGAVKSGESCKDDRECPPATLCQSAYGESRCEPVCCDDSQCPLAANLVSGCAFIIRDISKQPLFRVCATFPACLPFRASPCLSGRSCRPFLGRGAARTETFTGFSCYLPSASPPLGEGATYSSFLDCGDGLVGVNGVCRWACYTKDIFDTPPGLVTTALDLTTVGKGGCPPNQTCHGVTPGPSWYGVCLP